MRVAKKEQKMRVAKKKESRNVIEITEDVRVPGTDVILEAGDKIRVLTENAAVPIVFNDELETEPDDQIDFEEETWDIINLDISYFDKNVIESFLGFSLDRYDYENDNHNEKASELLNAIQNRDIRSVSSKRGTVAVNVDTMDSYLLNSNRTEFSSSQELKRNIARDQPYFLSSTY